MKCENTCPLCRALPPALCQKQCHDMWWATPRAALASCTLPAVLWELSCCSQSSQSQRTLRNAHKQPGNNDGTAAAPGSQNSYSTRWATNQQPLPNGKQSEWPCMDHFVPYLSFLFQKWESFQQRPAIRNGVFVLNVHRLFWPDLFLFSHVFSLL